MPDIQNLTSLVQQLDAAASWWNNKALWFVAFTAIAATGYLVTSLMASDRSAKLKNAQTQLIKAKDDQLAGDLKNKDVSISAADQKAADAKKETARLTKEAEQAKTERAEADKQIAIAKADAARAKEGIANAEAVSANAAVEVTRLQGVVANAERKRLEAEKALLELQERIRPRTLTEKQKSDFLAALRNLPNGTIDLGYTATADNDDGFDLARQFLPLFKKAEWTVRNEASIANHLEIQVIGIGILVRGPAATDPSKPPLPGQVELTPTLVALQSAFKAIGMDVQFINWHPAAGAIPEVVIGSKPRR